MSTVEPRPQAATVEARDGGLAFRCPRCDAEVTERFYGPCAACRDQLVGALGGEGRQVEVPASNHPCTSPPTPWPPRTESARYVDSHGGLRVRRDQPAAHRRRQGGRALDGTDPSDPGRRSVVTTGISPFRLSMA